MKQSLILTAFSFLVLGQLGLAQVAPQTVSYQGVLRDVSGNIVANDDYDILFTLYDNAGNEVWSEWHSVVPLNNPVTVTDGVFSVILGEATLFTGILAPPVELGIRVGGDAEMTPRIELTSVIYALHADRSDSSDYARKAEEVSGADNVFPGSGAVGIGTTSPTSALTVQGSIELSGAGNKLMFPDGTAQTSAAVSSPWDTSGSKIYYNQGNVGIGTASPSQKLDVNGTVLANGFALNNLNTKISSLTTNNIDLITSNAVRVRIDPSGNVGIGITTPAFKLDVAGDVKADNVILPATTRYYSIPAWGFKGSFSIDTVLYVYGWSQVKASAGVHLPHGAVITEFAATLEDSYSLNDSMDFDINLWKITPGSAPTSLALVATDGAPGFDTFPYPSPIDHQVDNINSTYLVTAVWKGPPTSSDLKLYSVRIKYTITKPLP